MKKIYFILMLLLIGELNEINSQTLNYGEYIQQYALIRMIYATGTKIIPCEDCICKLTVKKSSNQETVLNNRDMNYLGNALFGYRALTSELNVNTDYRALVNCTSPSFGSGFTDSTFLIIGNKGDGENIGGNCEFGDINCELNNIVLGIKNMFYELLTFIWNTIFINTKLYPNIIKPIYDFLMNSDIISYLINTLLNSINFLFKILQQSPIENIVTYVIPFFINLILGIFGLYVIWTIFFEAFVIGYVVLVKPNSILNPFEIILEILNIHIKILMYIIAGLYAILLGFIQVFNSMIKLLSFIRQIFQI